MSVVTSFVPKRLITFKGHSDQPSSLLITHVCKNYETVTGLADGECAFRTLNALHNLHTVRGLLNNRQELILTSSMSGPHHYCGYIDPTKYHTIHKDEDTHAFVYKEHNDNYKDNVGVGSHNTSAVVGVIPIRDYRWLTHEKHKYTFDKAYDFSAGLVDVDTSQEIIHDSLFAKPGILEMPVDELHFHVCNENANTNVDLREYKAQLVRNSEPFRFNQDLVRNHTHAQHKLRVITYYYGQDYLKNYLLNTSQNSSGVFLERHEFIQAITPIQPDCGGYIILGKEDKTKPLLELIAVRIPYGYTLLVDVGAIHGDSTLTGLHMMAMTGNHDAMATADTVFLKNARTRKNVRCSCSGLPVPVNTSHNIPYFMMSSDKMNRKTLKHVISHTKAIINQTLTPLQKIYWMTEFSCFWRKIRHMIYPYPLNKLRY